MSRQISPHCQKIFLSRCGRYVEELDSEMIGKLTYHERGIVVFARILFQKGILTPDELVRKMDEGLTTIPSNDGLAEGVSRIISAVKRTYAT